MVGIDDPLWGLLNGGVDPALGATIVNNPEMIAQHLASQGVPPPTLPPIPEGGGGGWGGEPSPLAVPAQPARPPASPEALGVPTGVPQQNLGQMLLSTPARGQPMPMGRPRPSATVIPPPGTPPEAATTPAETPIYGPTPLYGPIPDGAPTSTPATPVQAPPPSIPSAGSPLDIRAQAQRAGQPATRPTQQNPNDALKALQGIKAPPPPEAQKVSTPHPVRPNQLPANNALIQLLAQVMGGSTDVKPLTLGGALGGGRVR
jgi:hypothetical protein